MNQFTIKDFENLKEDFQNDLSKITEKIVELFEFFDASDNQKKQMKIEILDFLHKKKEEAKDKIQDLENKKNKTFHDFTIFRRKRMEKMQSVHMDLNVLAEKCNNHALMKNRLTFISSKMRDCMQFVDPGLCGISTGDLTGQKRKIAKIS